MPKYCILLAALFLFWPSSGQAQAVKAAPLSQATQACLECHASATPGIVADWQRSRMAQKTPAQALKEPELSRRISAAKVPADLLEVTVGCAECHTLNPASHPDTFDHDGHQVHTVVTPPDCAVCHPTEAEQYGQSLMSHAWGNLAQNPLYMDLARQINGVQTLDGLELTTQAPSETTGADSCFYCHGTEVKVIGQITRDTGDFGQMSFPKLSGWPNHGVGRKNPDGSQGSCTACHSRHQFAIQMARSPQTCSECHKGPDVVAYKVYEVSKHGNIYAALKGHWNLDKVPWVIGKDFNAPTCAACHMSLLIDGQGKVKAQRSHRLNDRLWWRLFGLVYSHPHPRDPDTSKIKNQEGLPLPTSLDGKPAQDFLISPQEQAGRRQAMGNICLACHGASWVEGHFARLEETLKTTDAMTLSSTRLLARAWEKGLTQGPAPKGSPFDEYLERVWVQQWLFHANSVRLSAAMAGADYGVFAGGRWELGKNLRLMHEWLKDREGKK